MSIRPGVPILLGAIFSVLIGLPVQAQSVQGTVRAEDGAPLAGVQISVRDTTTGVVTDVNGHYLLDHVGAAALTLEYRFVGFRTQVRDVLLMRDEDVLLDVTMREETLEFGELIITAESQEAALLKRSTRSVVVLDAKALGDLQGQTLGQMLETLPGVTSLTTGPSISKPVIRGLHSQRVVVLNNGVVQEGQQWGGEHGPEIDPFSPGRIEVIKGAASVEYGIGAIGGVIRVEPEELPYRESISGTIHLNGYSNNRQVAGSGTVQGGYRGVGWRIQSSARRAGDSRTPEHIIRNSGFRELDGSIGVGYEGRRVGWKVMASHFGTTLGLYTGAHIGNVDDLLRAIERGEPAVDHDFSFDIDAPKQRIDHDLISAKGHIQLSSGDWLEAQYGYQANRRAEFDAHARGNDLDSAPAFSLRLNTHSLDLKLRAKPRGSWLGVAGISVMEQSNRNRQTGLLIPNFRSRTGGVFAHGSRVSGPLTLEAGLRLDHRWLRAYPLENGNTGPFVRRTHAWTSPSAVLGMIWRWAEHWSLGASLGTAWRPPGVNELYNFGVHHGTARFEAGNANLEAEQSVGVDATLRHVSETFTVEFSSYVNRLSNFIYLAPAAQPRVTIRGSFPAFDYSQTDARLAGIDGSILARAGSGLELTGTLSVVRAWDLNTDEPIPNMPADRVRLLAHKTIGSTHIGMNMTMVARQRHVTPGTDFAEPPSGYTLFGLEGDAVIPVGSEGVEVGLTIDNLFNNAYRDYLSRFRYFIDDPGRTITLRAHIPIGPRS